jgi:SAM-dependent methyltransferase
MPSLLPDAILPLRTFARRIKRAVTPPGSGRLAASQSAGTMTGIEPPAALEAGSTPLWQFRIENKSAIAWPAAGPFAVRIECRWKTFAGEPFGEAVTVPLPTPLYPGEPQTIAARIPAPAFVGDFIFSAVLTQGDGPLPGAPSAVPSEERTVPVVGSRSTDIDYHAVFRTANLTENHWWVVGAYASKEQFERSQRERLEMLQKHGLTPDSRLLDIGCGTGQMAAACESFFRECGGYSGTDIGAEAIEFCKRSYRRNNFRFARGGMTTVPFAAADGLHDMAIFFSVFTHTFTDETALLLAEASRLLKPTGVIIADVITSPLVERGAGHRGEMIVNRDHFLRLASAVGLDTGEIIGRWPWNPQAERIMVKFRKR